MGVECAEEGPILPNFANTGSSQVSTIFYVLRPEPSNAGLCTKLSSCRVIKKSTIKINRKRENS